MELHQWVCILVLGFLPPAVMAASNPANNNLAINADKAAAKKGPLVFSAPPRETEHVGDEKYGPIAAYLTKVLHRKVVYEYPGTWGVYRTQMLAGDYDIVFDGPHFNSYRAQFLHHHILVTIPHKHEFAVIVRPGETQFHDLADLAGHTFCTHAPPNLGTLALLSHFPNPERQPAIVNTRGWKHIYEGVMSGLCEAGVLPIANLKAYDKTGKAARIIFRDKVMPNQAFSAGPRVTPTEQHEIAQALISPAAEKPTAMLRSTYRVGSHFVLANNAEFKGMDRYLKGQWGYY
jgi:hypothetical protein